MVEVWGLWEAAEVAAARAAAVRVAVRARVAAARAAVPVAAAQKETEGVVVVLAVARLVVETQKSEGMADHTDHIQHRPGRQRARPTGRWRSNCDC